MRFPISFIYATIRDFDLHQLWSEMQQQEIHLEVPGRSFTYRVGEQEDDIGENYEATRLDLERYLQEKKMVSYKFWYKEPGEDVFCSLDIFEEQYMREYFSLHGAEHFENKKVALTKALVGRAIKKAKRNSLLLFTFDPYGHAEDVDFEAVAKGNADALTVVPEVLGVPETTARRLRARIMKEGFQERQVESTVFFHSAPLPWESFGLPRR